MARSICRAKCNGVEVSPIFSTKPCFFAGLLVFFGEKRRTELVEVFMPNEMTGAEPLQIFIRPT
jgi:hypothetical protein